MVNYFICTAKCVLLLSLTAMQRTACASDLVFQWSDAQGQIHYGDTPPLAEKAETITLERSPHAGNNTQGLRPGERALLGTIERRQQQQQTRSRAARSRVDEQRTALRKQCRNHREMLKLAQGRDNFKQHARFLRSNCW